MTDIGMILSLWQHVMQLDTHAFKKVLSLEFAPTLTLFLVVFSGLSFQLGQSVILIINRVRPPRFVLSIAVGVLLYLVNILIWSLTTWGLAMLLLPFDITFYSVLTVICLSQAPLVLGILSFLPFFGIAVGWLVAGYSLILASLGVSVLTDTSILFATIPVSGGWVILSVFQAIFGRPLTELTQKMRARVAGLEQLSQDVVPAELIEQFAHRVENEHGGLA
jgi:hypothetical protein